MGYSLFLAKIAMIHLVWCGLGFGYGMFCCASLKTKQNTFLALLSYSVVSTFLVYSFVI